MPDYLMGRDIGTEVRDRISAATQSLHIFSPYITLAGLSFLLDGVKLDSISVYTTWDRDDIVSGASDVSIYPYLKERGVRLFLCERLHMKGVLIDSGSFILGSANITQNGLGLHENANVECMTYIPELGLNDRLWLLGLIQNSMPVAEEDYQMASAIEVSTSSRVSAEPPVWQAAPPDFLVSRLPCFSSPQGLLEILTSLSVEDIVRPDDELRYALHDFALYDLRVGESFDASLERLKTNFMKQPFTLAFCDFVKMQGRYFGETKQWIQETCVDDPAPHRRDLTERIRILFDWMVQLAPDQYEVTQPNYSECISFVGADMNKSMATAAFRALSEIGKPTHIKD
jgi:hypothetical protein